MYLCMRVCVHGEGREVEVVLVEMRVKESKFNNENINNNKNNSKFKGIKMK